MGPQSLEACCGVKRLSLISPLDAWRSDSLCSGPSAVLQGTVSEDARYVVGSRHDSRGLRSESWVVEKGGNGGGSIMGVVEKRQSF